MGNDPYKWPYKWVTGVITPTYSGWFTPFITGLGAHLVRILRSWRVEVQIFWGRYRWLRGMRNYRYIYIYMIYIHKFNTYTGVISATLLRSSFLGKSPRRNHRNRIETSKAWTIQRMSHHDFNKSKTKVYKVGPYQL